MQKPKTWSIEPFTKSISNESFTAAISPETFDYTRHGYIAFKLIIRNKTTEGIKLDWNKTLYIENGQTKGGFMFEGITYEDRDKPKPLDIISAGSVFEKIIYPSSLVLLSGWWYHSRIPPGNNGIYLTIRVNEKEIKETIILNMIFEYNK
jgi:hypothetical protein